MTTDISEVRAGSPEWFSWHGYFLTEEQALALRQYLNDNWLADAVMNQSRNIVSDQILAEAVLAVFGAGSYTALMFDRIE